MFEPLPPYAVVVDAPTAAAIASVDANADEAKVEEAVAAVIEAKDAAPEQILNEWIRDALRDNEAKEASLKGRVDRLKQRIAGLHVDMDVCRTRSEELRDMLLTEKQKEDRACKRRTTCMLVYMLIGAIVFVAIGAYRGWIR